MGDGDDNENNKSINNGSRSQYEDNVDHSYHKDEQVQPEHFHTHDRCGRDIMQGDAVSFLFFSFNIVSKQISRTTTETAGNQSVGIPQGAIILPSEIHQADVPGIQTTGFRHWAF